MSTCLGRLGSRYSLILDPHRRTVHYGALGLMCQKPAELALGLRSGRREWTLPLSRGAADFFCVDQHQTMTSVRYEAHCLDLGAIFEARLTAPFWPQDERTSLVPAYILELTVRKLDSVRWKKPPEGAPFAGTVFVDLRVPDTRRRAQGGNAILFDYDVEACDRMVTGEGGAQRVYCDARRKSPLKGKAHDALAGLHGPWRARAGRLEAAFDVGGGQSQTFTAALVGHMADPLFERFGNPMPLKYTRFWKDRDAAVAWVRRSWRTLLRKSRDFDALFESSGLTASAQNLSALSFQSYLMCSLWAYGPMTTRAGKPLARRDWFSVWEGSCWFHSTVDVTYNEAPFYFSCWPQLMELLFDEWSDHANDFEGEKRRRAFVSDDDLHGNPLVPFPGAIMEHDMGSGWSSNGQSYHHAMPVEENANFLLLLYAHGRWWGREALYRRHAAVCRGLAEYLLWADSTGNGFPDRGTANTIDDANPAVQYGRDNVYLGVKRLAGLHAAARIFEATGDRALAARCRREVRKAIRTLDGGWLGDHYPVVLDKSAKGLLDSWTKQPLTYDVLPGWDGYSLYTTNGLLFLMMVGDLPKGLDLERIREDLHNAVAHSLTPYGCSHSSYDPERLWISMNVWRDCAAAYLGEDLSGMCDRYWAQQLFGNGPGAEKPNTFTETSLANNLVWYPRGAAAFALPFAMAGLVLDRAGGTLRLDPVAAGRWPLLPLARWSSGAVPAAVARREAGRLVTRVE